MSIDHHVEKFLSQKLFSLFRKSEAFVDDEDDDGFRL